MVYGLPARDETDWDVKLNASIEAVKAVADAAETPTGAQAKVSTHASAADPHGDRAYVDDISVGGVYASTSSTVLAYGAPTSPSLSTTSGDNLVSGGAVVIPVGGDGIWALSATWMAQNANALPTRAFLDIVLNGTSGPTNPDAWRVSMAKDEDRATIATSRRLVAGDTVTVNVYWAAASGASTPKSYVVLNAYRVAR